MITKTKFKHLEANMEIIRNNQDIMTTITGKNYKDFVFNIVAYANSGNQVFLNLNEEEKARQILLSSKT